MKNTQENAVKSGNNAFIDAELMRQWLNIPSDMLPCRTFGEYAEKWRNAMGACKKARTRIYKGCGTRY